MVADQRQLSDAPPAGRPVRRAAGGAARSIAVAALAVAAAHLVWAQTAPPASTGWGPGAIPSSTILAVGCLALSFICLLRLPGERPVLLAATVVALAVVLHGTVALVEEHARFPTAWLHAGYTAHVMTHHDVLPSLGARFSWPAFFVMTAAAFSPAGDAVPELVLRFAPMFFVLACLPAVLVIARRCLAGWRAPWIAVWIFLVINWLGQDYFAPQSLAFLLGLTIIAVLLKLSDRPPVLWRPRDGIFRAGGLLHLRGAQWADAGSHSHSAAHTGWLMGAFLISCAAVAMSHQLTPFVIAVQLAMLWFAGRLPWILPAWIVGLGALVWVSWGASDFWIPFLSDVFGGVGDPLGNVTEGIVERTGGSEEHLLVVAVRIGLAAAVVLAAVLGIVLEYVRERRIELSLPLLAAAPGVLLLVQSYGGEGVLRIYLFAAPFLAMLIAKAFVSSQVMTKAAAAALVAVTLAATPVFLIARYGNTPFERTTGEQVALADCMYDRAPSGSTLGAVSPHLAWQFRDVAEHRHVYANSLQFDTENVDELLDIFNDTPFPRYLIVTEPQLQFVTRSLGAPPEWAADLTAELDADPRLRPVCMSTAGVVYSVGGERG